jgi:hypothetical protein
MGPRFGVYALSSLLLGLLAIACAPTRAKGRSVRTDSASCTLAPDEHVEKGNASFSTWLTVQGFDTRMQMPSGWEYAQQGSMIVASAQKHRAEYVVAGACTPAEAKQVLARGAKEFGLAIVGDVPEREVTVNGLRATRLDFEGALASGKHAHGVALVADSPKGKGFIVILGYVRDGHESLSRDFRQALDSITPS